MRAVFVPNYNLSSIGCQRLSELRAKGLDHERTGSSFHHSEADNSRIVEKSRLQNADLRLGGMRLSLTYLVEMALMFFATECLQHR